MSQSFKKLVTLLKELFQLDRPDLDFGFYRIMHAKSAEVTQFLEQDLLPQVQAALPQHHLRRLMGIGTPRSLQGRALSIIFRLIGRWRRLTRTWGFIWTSTVLVGAVAPLQAA